MLSAKPCEVFRLSKDDYDEALDGMAVESPLAKIVEKFWQVSKAVRCADASDDLCGAVLEEFYFLMLIMMAFFDHALRLLNTPVRYPQVVCNENKGRQSVDFAMYLQLHLRIAKSLHDDPADFVRSTDLFALHFLQPGGGDVIVFCYDSVPLIS